MRAARRARQSHRHFRRCAMWERILAVHYFRVGGDMDRAVQRFVTAVFPLQYATARARMWMGHLRRTG